MDALKHLGGSNHFVESLPAPSSLLQQTSSNTVIVTSSEHENQKQSQQHHLLISNYENVSAIIRNEESSNGEEKSLESFHMQPQQFIHHALSTTNSRHRRSLSFNGDRRNKSNFKRHLIKRILVKRNFPNNQLSPKSSDEMNVSDGNELELDEESDDEYIEHDGERLSKKRQKTNLDGEHDRLEDGDNENNLDKSMKMFVPYWDAYDTVNQLFLVMGGLIRLELVIYGAIEMLFGDCLNLGILYFF